MNLRWPVEVTPAERPILGALVVLAMLKGASVVYLETPAETLFLVDVGAGNLPYVYMVTAVVASAFGVTLARRHPREEHVAAVMEALHDGERSIAELGSREVFGELAALDPEVRSASVTAEEEGLLFRVSRRMLYDLMAERTEVARGIIAVLCRRIRRTIGAAT